MYTAQMDILVCLSAALAEVPIFYLVSVHHTWAATPTLLGKPPTRRP